jgi:peroxiredoxin
MLATGHSQGRAARNQGSLTAGDEAPDFTLKTLDGSAEVTLSNYRGECPVALIFGSYT